MEPRIEVVQEVKQPTTWAVLEAESRRYRDGFVDLFLKYKDAPLEGGGKVTRKAFEEHFGLASSTFGEWLRKRGETRGTGGASTHQKVPDSGTSPESDEDIGQLLATQVREHEARLCLHCPVHCPEE